MVSLPRNKYAARRDMTLPAAKIHTLHTSSDK